MNNFKNFNNISDELIYLRKLTTSDISKKYISWLNNIKINQFLESRHVKHESDTITGFVNEMNSDNSNNLLLGIFLSDNNEHIGNIKLGSIDWKNKNADIGILIGESNYWGKGIATRAINLLTNYAFQELNLKSLSAGCYLENIGSKKAFLKAGWKVSGVLPNHRINNLGKFTDEVILTCTNKNKLFEFPLEAGVTLIGNGDLLIKTAILLREKSINVLSIFAKRHVDKDSIKTLRDNGCKIIVSEDINDDKIVLEEIKIYNRFALCFGPAWIFNKPILDIYNGRIFNLNGIPLPKYLGGAHYSWQILNKNKSGGSYIQQITSKIDRGPIALSSSYQVPNDARYPIEFINYNIDKGFDLIADFINIILTNPSKLRLDDELINWNEHIYLPRLNTDVQSWINWCWSGDEIERFCCAFDKPYSGARSKYHDHIIILQDVFFHTNKDIHPFCAGLIIRIDDIKNFFWVAVKGGFIEIRNYYFLKQSNKDIKIKLGGRLITPQSLLENSFKSIKYNASGTFDVK